MYLKSKSSTACIEPSDFLSYAMSCFSKKRVLNVWITKSKKKEWVDVRRKSGTACAKPGSRAAAAPTLWINVPVGIASDLLKNYDTYKNTNKNANEKISISIRVTFYWPMWKSSYVWWWFESDYFLKDTHFHDYGWSILRFQLVLSTPREGSCRWNCCSRNIWWGNIMLQ